MKRILVALDGSARAAEVLAYAVSLAQTTGAKLLLLRTFGVPPDMQLAWPLSDVPLETALRTQAQEDIDSLAKAVPAALLEAAHVVLGIPWQSVCTTARNEGVDLIVIGSHGFEGLDHVLGTTAAKIVNHADRPVLVVRPIPPN